MTDAVAEFVAAATDGTTARFLRGNEGARPARRLVPVLSQPRVNAAACTCSFQRVVTRGGPKHRSCRGAVPVVTTADICQTRVVYWSRVARSRSRSLASWAPRLGKTSRHMMLGSRLSRTK